MNRTAIGTALALAASVAISMPAAAATPASLPAVKRTLSAGKTTTRACPDLQRRGTRGVSSMVYRAPMSGYVRVNLATRDSSDWDLAIFDGQARRRIDSSSAFGSHEVAEGFVSAGERVVVQGCRKAGSARHAAVAVRFTDTKPPKFDGVAKQVTVFVRNQTDVARLEDAGLDVTHDAMSGQVDALVFGTSELNALDATGLKYRVRVDDLVANSNRARAADARAVAASAGDPSPLPSGRKTYRTLEDYQAELKAIADTYGPQGLVRPMTIGKTREGRPIQGLEIADGVEQNYDGRPTYVVVAMHHAREWPSAEAAMEFAWMLVKGYGSNDQITSLLKRERIVVIPILNIDGFDVSRRDSQFSPTDQLVEHGQNPQSTLVDNLHTAEAVTPGGPPAAYRRKNCKGTFPNGVGFPCEFQYGVDPNRNYGNGWGGPGASSDPTSQTFRGDGPWSEPETQAMWHLAQHRAVTSLITLHNVAALVLRPPGLSSAGFAPDEDAMKKLGDDMADDTGYTSQFSWQLYDTSGTTEDWNYAAAGTFGYTIEMGPEGGQFHMPYQTGVIDQWMGTHGRDGLRTALLRGAEAGVDPVNNAVIEGHAPDGRVLRLHKSFKTSTSPKCQVSDPLILSNLCDGPDNTPTGTATQIDDQLDYTMRVPPGGSYSWMVGPSTRPFVAEKRELGTQTQIGQQKWDGTMPVDGSQAIVPFTVDNSPIFRMTIDLEWDPACATDLDLYIYWHDTVTDEWRQVASSGSAAGSCEQAVLIQPRPGEYQARVDLFASPPATPYHITRTDYAGDIKITRTGKTEAFTMTCETPEGVVLETKEVTVGRGETAKVNFGRCNKPSLAPGSSGPGSDRAAPGAPATGGVLGQKVPSKAKRKATSKRVRCLKRANKIKSKAKRRRAIKHCKKRYPAKHHKAKKRHR